MAGFLKACYSLEKQQWGYERRLKINEKYIRSSFLIRHRRLLHIVVVLLSGSTLFFLFTKFYPQDYETLKVSLFSNDVFYRVEGKSMLPTFHDQQMWYGSPCDNNLCRNSIRRGDIIIFDARRTTGKEGAYIKRVIGIPLDYITITGGNVYVNNLLLIEPYVSVPTATNSLNDCQSYHIGSEQVFVLGDNRTHSHDSRIFGPVGFPEIWGVSRFQKYNSVESLAKLDLARKLQIDETDCPVWMEH